MKNDWGKPERRHPNPREEKKRNKEKTSKEAGNGKAPRDRQIIYPKGQTNYLTEVFEGTDKDSIEGTDKFLRDH
jgi:hypothetical protein